MTPFETIILIALYLFAFSYMAHSFSIGDERNNWVVRLTIIIAAATIGIIYFPTIFAEDIWNKLSNGGTTMTRKLTIKCPKCRSNKEISAYETIEASTEFYFENGILKWTNNEYGNGVRVDFACHSCHHIWTGKKGITIDNYTMEEEQ